MAKWEMVKLEDTLCRESKMRQRVSWLAQGTHHSRVAWNHFTGCIEYKVLVLAFRAIHGSAPGYLCEHARVRFAHAAVIWDCPAKNICQEQLSELMEKGQSRWPLGCYGTKYHRRWHHAVTCNPSNLSWRRTFWGKRFRKRFLCKALWAGSAWLRRYIHNAIQFKSHLKEQYIKEFG
jgi:hypothetical protein